ncbi:MAG TPA: isochorismatase family protein [Candidatus Polarisedimenticolia bacterium]|nr:isochorismatase family protein [Candidatus Polarisedimenticolia bacterium]
MNRLIFWDVDTQCDFISPDGKLHVPRAEAIVPRLAALTDYAHTNGIRIVASAEEHLPGDSEFSDHPDFETTWPPHCVRGTPGQQKIPETALPDALAISFDRQEPEVLRLGLSRHAGNLLILKRHFDVFSNPNTDTVVRALDPEAVVVYGLPLEICVRHVVEGWLARRPHTRLFVVTDAVKAVRYELGEHALRDWGDAGVRLVKAEEVVSEGTLDTWLKPA